MVRPTSKRPFHLFSGRATVFRPERVAPKKITFRGLRNTKGFNVPMPPTSKIFALLAGRY